jgi:hypothetical protein
LVGREKPGTALTPSLWCGRALSGRCRRGCYRHERRAQQEGRAGAGRYDHGGNHVSAAFGRNHGPAQRVDRPEPDLNSGGARDWRPADERDGPSAGASLDLGRELERHRRRMAIKQRPAARHLLHGLVHGGGERRANRQGLWHVHHGADRRVVPGQWPDRVHGRGRRRQRFTDLGARCAGGGAYKYAL